VSPSTARPRPTPNEDAATRRPGNAAPLCALYNATGPPNAATASPCAPQAHANETKRPTHQTRAATLRRVSRISINRGGARELAHTNAPRLRAITHAVSPSTARPRPTPNEDAATRRPCNAARHDRPRVLRRQRLGVRRIYRLRCCQNGSPFSSINFKFRAR
jgi:hypothetical protein